MMSCLYMLSGFFVGVAATATASGMDSRFSLLFAAATIICVVAAIAEASRS